MWSARGRGKGLVYVHSKSFLTFYAVAFLRAFEMEKKEKEYLDGWVFLFRNLFFRRSFFSMVQHRKIAKHWWRGSERGE